MLRSLFTKAPLIAVLGATILFTIVAGAGLGLDWPLLTVVALAVFAIGESFALWSYWKKSTQAERHLRHFRFIADRFQAMLRSMPGGYCLFTPQGLLREEVGVAERVGLPKITHMDDLVGVVKEGAELLEGFRKLQSTGESFFMTLHALGASQPLWLAGQRFRIGKEGPHIDILWFYDLSGQDMEAAVLPPMAEEEGRALKEEVVSAPPVVAPVPVASTPAPAPTKPAPVVAEASSIDRCFDLLPFPVWGRGDDLSLVFCNQAYARAMDVPREAVLTGQKELLEASSKNGKRLAGEALAKGSALTGRDHAVINGRRRLLQVVERPLPVRPEEGVASCALIGFAIDVTGEEEKEKELRRHLVSHHEVMEHLGAAIAVFGPDAKMEFYNRAYQRLWEAQESFLDSKPTFGEVLEDLRSRRRIPEQADFQKYKKEYMALFTSLLEPKDDVMHLPDGTSLRNLIAPHPMGGLMFVYENVTDQLELETSYNTLMAVQCETIDNLAEGIIVFGPDGRVRLSNPAFAKLWGVEASFLKAEPHAGEVIEACRSLWAIEDEAWPSYKEKLVSYALDRTPRAGRIDRADKAVIEYLTVPLPDGSVLNSFLNVTNAVHVEQALRASNAALATADRLKSDFVANVSYQLRTPLNTIIGFAEILSEQYFGALNERQMEYTTTIRAESEKLARLINDVLDLATIEAGRMALDRRPLKVADLLNEAKQMTAEWSRQQLLEILIDCPTDIGSLEADEPRLKQVLFNLISNAIKYTPAGGHIALAAWAQDEWVVLSVLDTGVGIPEEDKERVFGKFEKTNTHLRQSGAGLGLSLVKSIVELHGGRVEIFSDEKDGTRVSCFLPRKAPLLPVREG